MPLGLVHHTDRKRPYAIGAYIESFCNRERLRSHLDYVSPIEFELKEQAAAMAA